MIMVMTVRLMNVTLTVAVMMAAGQQPGAGDIDHETKDRNRDGLVEADGNRVEQARYGFIADQERNHRQNDGAGIPGEIAELAGAERETAIAGIFAGIGIGERGEQQRAGMRRHVQAVGNQRKRAEQGPADDFGNHHDGAEDDHRPGAPLGSVVILAQKQVVVRRDLKDQFGVAS